MIPVSLCMIVKNEQEQIGQCLKSVAPYLQEIIVVDTGSNDATKDIAKDFTTNIYDFSWNNSFSEARNYSILKATNPMILVMDSDEMLDHASLAFLAEFCGRQDHSAGRVKLVNQTSDSSTITEIVRIFPNDGNHFYSGRIHEQLMLRDGKTPTTCSTNIRIFHSGYTQEQMNAKNKLKRNIELLLFESKENPLNPYIWYQLGKTHYVNKSYSEAASCLQYAIDLLAKSQNMPPYVPNLLVQYAHTLIKLRNFQLLFSVLETGLDLYPDFTDIYFIYGTALMELQDVKYLDRIRELFEACLALGEANPSDYESVTGVGSFKASYNLGVYYETMGNYDKAISYYELSAQSGYPLAIHRLALLK